MKLFINVVGSSVAIEAYCHLIHYYHGFTVDQAIKEYLKLECLSSDDLEIIYY